MRKRFGDIAFLTDHFVSHFCSKYNKTVLEIDDECRRILENYDWPGNVRELKNSLQRAVLLSRGDTMTPELLPSRIIEQISTNSEEHLKYGMTLAELEKQYISFSMKHQQNKSLLAKSLGISRKSLYNKLTKYGL